MGQLKTGAQGQRASVFPGVNGGYCVSLPVEGRHDVIPGFEVVAFGYLDRRTRAAYGFRYLGRLDYVIESVCTQTNSRSFLQNRAGYKLGRLHGYTVRNVGDVVGASVYYARVALSLNLQTHCFV